MLLTRASEYALLALNLIQKSDSPLSVDTISQELNLPKSFLAKLLQTLAKEGILASRRGITGGFVLAKEPNDITMIDIIYAAEGKRVTVFDCDHYADSCPFGKIGTCSISPFLANFQTRIDDFLSELTLQEILNP